VTPNFAFGGNLAIEGSATLSNSIVKLLRASRSGHPSLPAISGAFQEYQETHKARVGRIFTTSYYATRMQSWDNFIMRFIAKWVAPWMGDQLVADYTATLVKGGASLHYVPVPEHEKGTKPFDDEIGGKQGKFMDV
jgi:hypothetical protein